MKHLRALLPLAFILSLATVFAQEAQEYTFADIAWLSAPQTVIDKMEAEGYTATTTQPEGENNYLTFNGRLLNKESIAIAYFDETDQLLRFAIYLLSGDVPRASKFFTAEETYNTLKDVLTERYGSPSTSTEEFIDPYYRGDGYETQAVEQDKADFTTAWFSTDGGGILISIDNDVDAYVTYESGLWTTFLEEQQDEESDVF